MIRIVLPAHLRTLASVDHEVQVNAAAPVTIKTVLDALEQAYPMLRGTIREHVTLNRRALVRFFVCNEDWSHEPSDKELPAAVPQGKEPFFIVGAIAGG